LSAWLVAAIGLTVMAEQPRPPRPLIIGHRGASGYRPEHTLESYRLAIAQAADYIEPDLVMTKDGVLVARHENEIGLTTDAAAKFPQRRVTKIIDGDSVTGWFIEDFTLAEVKTLRAKERLASRSRQYDGRFEVPTFAEILELVKEQERATGRRIGIYPETKHPSHHEGLGLAITDSLIEALHRAGYRTRDDPVFIQSFEAANLRVARVKTGLRLIQLIESEQPTPDRLREIASYADGIGPSKLLVQPVSPDGELVAPTSLVADAHAAELVVHVWTVRAEPQFLAAGYRGDPLAEYRRLAALGVDGIFTDFPDQGVAALGR
jgi:glycerophosphoryl diester phosphodiesterase